MVSPDDIKAKFSDIDEQLKDLYDSLQEEDEAKQSEVEAMKKELSQVHVYLDSFNIPRKHGNLELTALERLTLAMETKKTA